jgi:hypothetical protein
VSWVYHRADYKRGRTWWRKYKDAVVAKAA